MLRTVALLVPFLSLSVKGAELLPVSANIDRCGAKNLNLLEKRASGNDLSALRVYGVTMYECGLYGDKLVAISMKGAQANDPQLTRIYFRALAQKDELILGLGLATQGGERGDRLSRYWFIKTVKYYNLVSLRPIAEKWRLELIRNPDQFGHSELSELVFDAVRDMRVGNYHKSAVALHFVDRYAVTESDEEIKNSMIELRVLILEKARELGVEEKIIRSAKMQK
jgi:hypothetical protein